jgi:hypothetical protein
MCLLVFAALLAGCGGGGSTTSTTSGAPHGFAAIEQAAYRFAGCMRQHGVPSFPDPQPVTNDGGPGLRQDLPPGLKGSPAFETARKDCAGILPEINNSDSGENAQAGHQRELGLLSFADCMRSHGVSNFPDPNTQGQISVETLAADGVNIHLPYVINAAVACIPASHGVVSRSVIAHAESQGG